MGDTFNISGSNINLAKDHGTANQTNYTVTRQDSLAELLRLLEAVRAQVPNLPEEVRAEVNREVEAAQIEAKKEQPDKVKITDRLNKAAGMLKAVAATATAAVPVSDLLGKAAVACAKMFGM